MCGLHGEELARLGRDYLARNVAVYAINSNDASTYPGDSPEKMKEEAETWGYELSVPDRCRTGRCQGLSCRVHAGFFCF